MFCKWPGGKSKNASADNTKRRGRACGARGMEDIHSGAISTLKSGGQAISSALPVTGWISESLTALS